MKVTATLSLRLRGDVVRLAGYGFHQVDPQQQNKKGLTGFPATAVMLCVYMFFHLQNEHSREAKGAMASPHTDQGLGLAHVRVGLSFIFKSKISLLS